MSIDANNANTELNTNIDDYNVNDLLKLFNLDDNPSISHIKSNANNVISQLKTKVNNGDIYDKSILYFFESAKDKLLYIFSKEDDKSINSMNNSNNFLSNNTYLPPNDRLQDSKLTNRVDSIETWNENGHYAMKQRLLGVNQSVQIPIVQDILNPTLRNLNSRIVNIDSRFRQNILPFNSHDADALSSPTNYVCELSETLTKAVSMFLYSVQIPNSWYRFCEEQGNTCFKVFYNSTNYYFNLPSGNYDVSSIVLELNNNSNWNPSPKPSGLQWRFNQTNSKLSFTTGNLSEVVFYFYDISNSIQCDNGKSCLETMGINKNLGWCLGYRPDLDIYSTKKVSNLSFIKRYPINSDIVLDSVIDLTGPKYFSIILDDFNKNRQNKGMVNIALIENTKIVMPSYYNNDVIHKGKTQAQSYSINQIMQNGRINLQKKNRLISNDVLAILPIDMNLNTRTQPYTVFGVNLLFNERRYYGPVDITKLKIRLVDDNGITVNLNGADWNMSLIVNELYQY